nr:hypothetical protein Iba_chr08fCG5200 [Ipomoea batatas]GMD89745.1 hypothetical protein Iba_chr14dCG3000 [Ipomoea batatas]
MAMIWSLHEPTIELSSGGAPAGVAAATRRRGKGSQRKLNRNKYTSKRWQSLQNPKNKGISIDDDERWSPGEPSSPVAVTALPELQAQPSAGRSHNSAE